MNAREFAERSLLGVLLHQPARITNLVGWLAPQDFHRPAHQVIYRELRDMVAEATTEATAQAAARSPVVELSGRYAVPGVDPVTLYDRIQASGELDRRGISALSLLTLMETAPPLATAQPEQYGQMVLEASIRRAVAQDGLRVGQVADTSTDLAHLLAAVETALEKVDHALRRWEGAATSSTIQLTTRADRSARRAAAGRRAGYAELVAVPSPEQLAQAERGLLGAVLHNPELLDHLAGQVLPQDFSDQRVAVSYRAALDVHAAAATTGRRVDPVTVAWQQQRTQAQHGTGLSPTELIEVSNTLSGHADYHAEQVLRGSVARLTRAAAAAVRTAARHPELNPTELLREARSVYETVTSTAERLTTHPPSSTSTVRPAQVAPAALGRTSPAARLAWMGFSAASSPAATTQTGAEYPETAPPAQASSDTGRARAGGGRTGALGARPRTLRRTGTGSQPSRADERGRG